MAPDLSYGKILVRWATGKRSVNLLLIGGTEKRRAKNNEWGRGGEHPTPIPSDLRPKMWVQRVQN